MSDAGGQEKEKEEEGREKEKEGSMTEDSLETTVQRKTERKVMPKSKKKGRQQDGDVPKKKTPRMERRSLPRTINRRTRRQKTHQNRVRRKLEKLRNRLEDLFQKVSYLGVNDVDHENVAHLSRGTLHKRARRKWRLMTGQIRLKPTKRHRDATESPATTEDEPVDDQANPEAGVAG